MSLICCLYIPGLCLLDAHFVWRGLLRLHRMAGHPFPDLLGLRPRPPAVDSFVFLLPSPSELAEATRGPNLGFLVPICIWEISSNHGLCRPPLSLQYRPGRSPLGRGCRILNWHCSGLGNGTGNSKLVRNLPPKYRAGVFPIVVVFLGRRFLSCSGRLF